MSAETMFSPQAREALASHSDGSEFFRILAEIGC